MFPRTRFLPSFARYSIKVPHIRWLHTVPTVKEQTKPPKAVYLIYSPLSGSVANERPIMDAVSKGRFDEIETLIKEDDSKNIWKRRCFYRNSVLPDDR